MSLITEACGKQIEQDYRESLTEFTTEQFIEYLRKLASERRETGHYETAGDYAEAADRLEWIST